MMIEGMGCLPSTTYQVDPCAQMSKVLHNYTNYHCDPIHPNQAIILVVESNISLQAVDNNKPLIGYELVVGVDSINILPSVHFYDTVA